MIRASAWLLWAALLAGCTPMMADAQRAALSQGAVDDDLVRLVPPDAETVLFVDVAALRASPWTKPVLASAPKRTRDRGFDELADIDAMVLAKVARAGASAPSLELLQGRFDRERVRKAFWDWRGPSGAADGGQADGDVLVRGDEALAFLTPRTLAWGPTRAVQAAVDVANGRARSVHESRWLRESRAALEDEVGMGRGRSAVELQLLVTDATKAQLGRELSAGEGLKLVAGRVRLGTALEAGLVGVARSKPEADALASSTLRTLRSARKVADGVGLGLLFERMALQARGSRVVGLLALRPEDREPLSAGVESLAKALRFASASPNP